MNKLRDYMHQIFHKIQLISTVDLDQSTKQI